MLNSYKLNLLRHGESVANRDGIFSSEAYDPPLTSKGILQVQQIKPLLSKFEFDRIISSPMLRAKQTAGLITDDKAISFSVANSLTEINFGKFECKNKGGKERAIIRSWQRGDLERCFPGGESFMDARNRLGDFLAHLSPKSGENILLIGHCLLFWVLTSHFCKKNNSNQHELFMSQGSVTILESNMCHKYTIQKFNMLP